MSRRRPVALAAAVAALLLSGCSPANTLFGLTENTAVLSNRPALSADQATAIAARALGQAQRADEVRSLRAAQSAYTGLALRSAPPRYMVELALNPAAKDSGGSLEPVVRPSRVVLTAGRAFPRSLLALWQPQGASASQVAVLDCADVRSTYRVAARATLLPGAALPATPPNTRGASALGPDVDDLVATPRTAVADLATRLATGTSPGTQFADDVVLPDVRAKAAAQAKAVANVASFSQRHVPEPDVLRVLRTADGGAVVVAAIDRRDLFTVRKGAGVINTPAPYRALAPSLTKIARSATVTTVQTVVLVLPRKGAGPARLIAFSEVPLSVTGS